MILSFIVGCVVGVGVTIIFIVAVEDTKDKSKR